MSEDITKVTDGYGAKYGGPQPGGNDPSSDDDLHDTGSNPYSSGTKWPNVVPGVGGDFGARNGIAGSPQNPGLPGYYSNPAPDPHNPYSAAVPTWRSGEDELSSSVASGFDNLYADALNARSERGQASNTQQPNGDIFDDEGYGTSGTGRS